MRPSAAPSIGTSVGTSVGKHVVACHQGCQEVSIKSKLFWMLKFPREKLIIVTAKYAPLERVNLSVWDVVTGERLCTYYLRGSETSGEL